MIGFAVSLCFLHCLTNTGGPDVGVYGRFGNIPSITRHDFAFFLNGEVRGDQEVFSRSEYLKVIFR